MSRCDISPLNAHEFTDGYWTADSAVQYPVSTATWLPFAKKVRAISRVFRPSLPSHLTHFDAMNAQKNLPRLPSDDKFRVLVIGRANAGKTSVLQRVCDTTESPVIYNVDSSGTRKRVRPSPLWHVQSHRLARFDSNLRRRSGGLILGRGLMADRDNPACVAWRT